MRYIVCLGIVLFLSGTSFPSLAQQYRKDKIEAMRIAYITSKLELTPKEAQVFWPVYNEYTDKLKTLRKNRKIQFREVKEGSDGIDSLSDKEVETLVDGEMAFRQKELDIQKEFHAKLKTVLPIKKVAKLYLAEESFKRELLKRLQEKKK